MKQVVVDSAKEQVTSITLAISSDVNKIATFAKEYGQLSRSEGRLAGVGIDDFVAVLRQWTRSLGGTAPAAQLLSRVIDYATGGGSGKRFGVTIYENELTSPVIKELPLDVRLKIDRVSLYLRYRENARNFPGYVRVTRELFPKAQILAGVYAYDRVDYVPCGPKSPVHCSRMQEQDLFETALRIQDRMIRDGEIAGLEFYPGYFGREDTWNGWSVPRLCQESRRDECVAVTLDLRAVVMRVLGRPVGRER